MSSKPSPAEWTAPIWHPDFGNVQAEFDYLKELAIAFHLKMPRVALHLEIPEPGLMYLQVAHPNGCIAEVYSNEDDDAGRLYAMFRIANGSQEEEEIHVNSVSQVLAIVSSWTTERG